MISERRDAWTGTDPTSSGQRKAGSAGACPVVSGGGHGRAQPGRARWAPVFSSQRHDASLPVRGPAVHARICHDRRMSKTMAAIALALAALTAGTAGTTGTAGAGGRAGNATGPTYACPPPVRRHAWAVDIGAGGRVRWESSLPLSVEVEAQVGPMTYGGLAYFFEGGDVTALERANGHRAWQDPGGQPGSTIYGAWLWHGALTVLDERIGRHTYARLQSVDARTGHVLWSHQIARNGIVGFPVLASDGYLSWDTSAGTVQTIDDADGRRVWSAPAYSDYVGTIAAAGDDVLIVRDGKIIALGAADGHQLWSLALPGIAYPAFQVVDGIALATSGIGGGRSFPPFFAVDPGTGRVLWRADVQTPMGDEALLASGLQGLALQGYHLYLVNPRTGKINWVDRALAGSAAISVSVPGIVVHTQAGTRGSVLLQAQSTGTGKLLWERTLPPGSGNALVVMAGTVVVSTATPRETGALPLAAYSLTKGRPLWRAKAPAFFVSNMALPSGGELLVDAADPPQACAVSRVL